MSANQRHLKAAEYRALAKGAADLAGASVLDNVRDKHAKAATRWEQLAVQIEPGPPEANR